MDGNTIIFSFGIATFCFMFVFWMKKSENKYKFKKTKMVDMFIKQREIHVEDLYIGSHFDLVNDTKNSKIWFFVLRHNTLQYKKIPYGELFQVEYKLDGHTVKKASRSGQLRRALIGGHVDSGTSPPPAVWKKDETIRAVKEVRLTVQVDDLKATVLDLIFTNSHLPVDIRHVKDKDAKKWFDIFTYVIDNEERKRA